MPAFYGAINLQKNELQNAVVQNLASAPASPIKGQLYFDSTGNILYWYNGSGWVAAQGGAGAVPATTVTTQAVGDAPVVGTLTTYAREDHKHGREAFGAPTAETTFGTSSATGSAATLPHSDHTHGNPTHAFTDHSTYRLDQWAAPTTSLNLNSQKLINVLDPTAPQDGATKNYVDITTQGLDAKASVHAATTANIATIAGGAPNTLDGVTLVANDRVLVKDQTTQSANGIYTVTTLGTGSNGSWTRSTDMDTWLEVPSAYVWVESGTTWADTGWVCTADVGGTLGTTNITWVQFSSAGSTIAGAGLTKTGNTIDVIAADTTMTINPDSIQVNTAVIATQAYVTTAITGMAKKFAAALTGTASPETVTHNLNTRDIQLTVLNGSTPYTAVEVDWDATTVNTATIRYNPNLGAGYRVVVVG